MTRENRPRITAAHLAEWLEQATDTWWTVDGDPYLGGAVAYPCEPADLAQALKRRGTQYLLLLDVNAVEPAKDVTPQELERYAVVDDQTKDRTWQMAWERGDPDREWLLIEETSRVNAWTGASG